MGSQFVELEPLLLSDNTEVKVLVSSNYHTETNSCAVHFADDVNDETYTPNVNDVNDNIIEYNRLITSFRQLPTDLFVNQILTDYSHSEVKLEETRSMLFETLQESDDFPLDRHCVMKRRVHSRTGDTVAVKLARDIHTILCVIEGAEFSELNSIISSTRRRERSKSNQRHTSTSNESICVTDASDINRLNGTVSQLQSDMLLLKQRQVALEHNRSEQMLSVKNSLVNVQDMIRSISATTANDVRDLKRGIENGSKVHVPPEEFLSLKQSVLFLSNSVEQLQHYVIKILNTVESSESPPVLPADSENCTSGRVVVPHDFVSQVMPVSDCTSGRVVVPHDLASQLMPVSDYPAPVTPFVPDMQSLTDFPGLQDGAVRLLHIIQILTQVSIR